VQRYQQIFELMFMPPDNRNLLGQGQHTICCSEFLLGFAALALQIL
jgi:hypothetical protein